MIYIHIYRGREETLFAGRRLLLQLGNILKVREQLLLMLAHFQLALADVVVMMVMMVMRGVVRTVPPSIAVLMFVGIRRRVRASHALSKVALLRVFRARVFGRRAALGGRERSAAAAAAAAAQLSRLDGI
jgi:hypothetical protein